MGYKYYFFPYAIALGIADKIVSKFSSLFKEPQKYIPIREKTWEVMDILVSRVDFMISGLNNFLYFLDKNISTKAICICSKDVNTSLDGRSSW